MYLCSVWLNAGQNSNVNNFTEFVTCLCHNGLSLTENTTFFFVVIVLQAYDQHLNMILGDVEEVVTSVEIDDETYEEIVRVRICFT